MCVDKTPQELPSFAALVTEAQQFTAPGHDWVMVFAAAMSGTLNQAPPVRTPKPRCNAWSMRSSAAPLRPSFRSTAKGTPCAWAESRSQHSSDDLQLHLSTHMANVRRLCPDSTPAVGFEQPFAMLEACHESALSAP